MLGKEIERRSQSDLFPRKNEEKSVHIRDFLFMSQFLTLLFSGNYRKTTRNVER